MCGISGIISKYDKNIIDLLFSSIKQLENRGYDSMGLCLYLNNEFQIFKSCNKMLDNSFKNDNSTIGIAHTRWATHGGVNINNTHPFISHNKKIILAHNGIVDNYSKLKNFLNDNNYIFNSDTDSEVIANLIDFFYMNDNINNINDAIYSAINLIEGTFGLTIICIDNPDYIYIIKRGSPIVIGENDNYIIATSETSGFVKEMNNYITLENDDLFAITKNGIVNFNNNIYNKHNIDNINYDLTPFPYEHWTKKEIMEQSDSILRCINNGARIKNNSIKLGGLNILNNNNYKNLILTGCGTSLHSCFIGSYYFKKFNYFNTIQVIDGSEFNDSYLYKNDTICILISQSGETKDLYNCIDIIKQNNCIAIGIINVVNSLIAREVHCGVYLNANREMAVASTKSFTSSLLVLYLISLWFYQKNNVINSYIFDNMHNLSRNISKVNLYVKNYPNLNNIILNLNKPSMFIIGKGNMEYVAKEGALKFKEITYVHCEGYNASSLKHGPFALLNNNFPVILLIDKCHKKLLLNAYEEIKSRNAYCLIITNDSNIDIDNKLIVPNNDFSDILFSVLLQNLAYELAIYKNINPDKPKNLAKVVSVD